jgi:hypothetical protein
MNINWYSIHHMLCATFGIHDCWCLYFEKWYFDIYFLHIQERNKEGKYYQIASVYILRNKMCVKISFIYFYFYEI